MDNRLCTSDFVINNLPAEHREFLSRKSVQDAICKFADVKIFTRGHFVKPRHDGVLVMDNKRPLSLHIVGQNKRNLALANQKIQSLLMNPEEIPENDEEETSDTEKITVGIDIFPTIFRMKTKILGENNENVEYILNETGAVMTLRGKGSGFIDLRDKKESDEPLHVHVRYKKLDTKERTRELILNLIETVQQDFITTYGKYYTHPKKPEIVPVPASKLRRTSSYNTLPARSPVRSVERPMERKSLERRSLEKRNLDVRMAPEPRTFEKRGPEPRPFDSRIPPEPRIFENRPPEPRPFDRLPETRPFENRAPEPRPFENRAPEPRPFQSRPPEPRPYESRVPESRPFENRNRERRLSENPLPDSTKTVPGESISNNIEKITIGIESVPASFNLKSKIYGPNLANVKHIEKTASALLLVEGKGCGANSGGEESQDPPYILVKYLKPDLKENARMLIFNLIETIQQEYSTLYGRYPGGPQKPQIVPINKKLLADKSASDSMKTKKPPSETTPVPPPPPVISKPVSPHGFDNVPPPANFGIARSKPLSPKLFASSEPIPVPRPVQPVIPSTSGSFDSSFGRLPDPEPLPVNPPLTGVGSQSSLLNSVLNSQSRLFQPPTFATSETSQAQIQTIQYSEKRPKSPEPATDAKRFCSTGVGTFNVSGPSAAGSSQRPNAPKGKNIVNNRYLVPVTVNTQTTAGAPKAQPKRPKKLAGILKKPQWNMRNGSNRVKSDSEEEGHDTKPIILSDSEDEEFNTRGNRLRISSAVMKNGARDISVQTDDKLYQTQIKNIKCACGRFMHVVTGVRSVETQTIGGESFRRF